MRHYISYPFFCIMVTILSINNTYADTVHFDSSLKGRFRYDMNLVRAEYYYHAGKYDDSKIFPAEREQFLIKKIEDEYFASGDVKELDEGYNLNAFINSLGFAKMFLRYGVDGLYVSRKFKYTSLIIIVRQTDSPPPQEDLPLEEVRDYVQFRSEQDADAYLDFGFNISTNSILSLAKLYLSLGVDIHAITTVEDDKSRNALTASYIQYLKIIRINLGEDYDNKEAVFGYIEPEDVPAIDPNPLPDYYNGLQPEVDTKKYAYRKSKVTYWLEEFIESGYSAEMLDTHKLHYPRFMKEASVEDVKDMLDNPQANAIKANINCNYDKDEDEDETPLICPLIPSINMRDAMGRTPLHIAGEQGNEDVFNYLKNNGADASIMDYRKNLAMLKTN